MGAKESRASILSFDEASKRVTTSELERIQEAYKRACGFAGIMKEAVFVRDVLGENVPVKLAQRIFAIMSTHSKGMTFRDLLVTLVVVARGRQEERLKLIYAVYCDDSHSGVTSKSMSNMMYACEKTALPHEAHCLFKYNDSVPYEQFRSWIVGHPEITSVTRWLINASGITVSLTDDKEMPNFYQTLAGVTHLDESDIIELEKRYWQLKAQSKTGKFDLATLKSFVCPPLPESLLQGLFNAFDENKDGHIDFKEISCGVSACCRGPLADRQKFCYKIFDRDQDGKLNTDELRTMALGLLEVQTANYCMKDASQKDIVAQVLRHSSENNEYVTLEEYQLWSIEDPLPTILLNMVFEICHVVLGLRPSSPEEEGTVIHGWMHRAKNDDYEAGETWYIISGKWWNAWKRYTHYDPSFSPNTNRRWEHIGLNVDNENTRSSSSDTIGSAHEAMEVMAHTTSYGKSTKTRGKSAKIPKIMSKGGSPGPINNSDVLIEENTKVTTLTDEGGRLKDGLVKGEDFEILPEPVWRALHHWYDGSPALPRIVPACNPGEKPWLELHRLHIVLLRHQLNSPMQQLSQLAFPGSGTLAGMGNTTLGMLKQSINYVAGGASTPKRHVAHRATFSRRHTVCQVGTFLSQRLRIPADSMRLWHLLDENNADLLDDETVKLETLAIKNNSQILLEVRNVDMSWPEELSQIARNHKNKMKQGEAKQVTVKGTTGLSNLGNTCFMNSSLQCISNTQPLTKYFLENKHAFELNKTNPLGTKGHLAKRYCDLAQDLWSGANKTVAPLKVRWTISKYAPQFNGFSQHDAQELLAFLLDGLHEDLNRVQEKPYVELKDSDGRPDEEVAQEAWENHLSRNQSIIVDLFHGQIRSRVRCLECGTISVRFDPFTFLSLPLPMDNLMYFDVIVIRLDGKTPVRYGLRLNRDDTFLGLRKQLSTLCHLPIDAILLVEVASSTVKSFLSDNFKVRSSSHANLHAYEIPIPQMVNIPISTSDPELTTPNGNLTCNSPRLEDRNAPEKLSSANLNSPRVGSSVHETSKRTVTNYSAMHLKPSTPKTSVSTDFEETTSSEASSENLDHKPPNGTPGSYPGNPQRIRPTLSSESEGSMTSFSHQRSSCAGYVMAFHRKTFHMEVYFLSSQKHRPSIFGLPLVVPCLPGQPQRELYSAVWKLVTRMVSPLPPAESTLPNHAQDCDDSLGTRYPFVLKSVQRCGIACGNKCPWFRFCKGCPIPCNDDPWLQNSEYIAIDWDPTALHLRYQPSVEWELVDDVSVEEGHQGQRQRIKLDHCLQTFTMEEELGSDELYHCGKCKKPQLAKKKLDIWRLPPILIIHLKRFQYVNGRWIKSHKVVDFPCNDFDPSHFMTQREKIEVVAKPLSQSGGGDVLTSSDVKGQTHTSSGVKGQSVDGKKEEKSKKAQHITFSEDSIMMEHSASETKTSSSGSSRPIRKAGPARRRQPSFKEDSPPLYDLFALSCHSGILGGGHYISYAKNQPSNKWYCYNDSSCKEVSPDSMNVETAYLLFYQLQDLDPEDFMPTTNGKTPVSTDSMDDDYNSEFRKFCVIQ